MSPHRLIIADDHPLFRDALEQTVASAFDSAEIIQTGSLDDVVSKLDSNDDVDLVLLDLKMPGVRGFSGLMFLRAQYPNIPVVVVSASEAVPVIRRALDLGASGFIPKSAPMDAMQNAIRSVLAGEIWSPPDIDLTTSDEEQIEADLARRMATLTPQQMRVLMMLRDGLLNKQIAYELSVSEATVKAHVSAILSKLNVDSRTQAVIAAGKLDGGV